MISAGRVTLLAFCIGQLAGCRSDEWLPPPYQVQLAEPVATKSEIDAALGMETTAPETADLTDAGSAVAPVREQSVASSAFPRLTHHQWATAAQQLLALDAPPDVSILIVDPGTATGFDNMGGSLDVSSDLWNGYQAASERLAHDVAANPEKLKRIGLASVGDASALSAFIDRAFRRAPTQTELSRYVELVKQAKSLLPERDPASGGAELLIAAVLQSPFFVYRAELANEPDDHGDIRLSGDEIAARLAFTLWDGLPDRELVEAARSGELQTEDGKTIQIERMLGSALAADKLFSFHRQWLGLASYQTVRDTGATAPDLGAVLYRESERFVRDVVHENDGSLTDLLLADFTYVNQLNAPLYGLSGAYGDDLQRVALDGGQRRGLLTQAGFLASHAGVTAPILRGAFVVKRVLCATLPPPPVFEQPELKGTTRRERVNSITGPGTCGAGCHATLINPAGYPFEYFDDLGRYRTTDEGEPVDGSASYTFQDGLVSYDGPSEWIDKLAQSREAHACYARHWLEYSYGRVADEADAPLLERMANASRSEHAPVKRLLAMLLQSPSFSTRRLEAQ